jgi:hypothetical protein
MMRRNQTALIAVVVDTMTMFDTSSCALHRTTDHGAVSISGIGTILSIPSYSSCESDAFITVMISRCYFAPRMVHQCVSSF